jgi:DNA-binding winged helix-turn-helix (wHTH) protein
MLRSKRTTCEIELDLGRYEIRRAGRRVKLEKKPMELLIFLVGRRDQLVSRKDIVTKLWRSDLFVDTERNINNIVRKIRTALGDDSAKPRFLETIVGKGYRFVGPLRVISPRHSPSESAQSTASALSDRSSLAVLPLFLVGSTTDDRGLCLGFADALISRLGNLQGVDVFPTSAVLSIAAEAAPSDIASAFGLSFAAQFSRRRGNCGCLWRCSMHMCKIRA